MSDPKAFGLAVVAVVRDFLGRALGPVLETQRELADRLAAMRERELPELVSRELEQRIKELPAPKDGLDADPQAVAAAVREGLTPEIKAVADRVERLEGLERQMPEMLVEAAAKALEELPRPRDGQTPSDETIAALVSKAVEALPRPKDGASPEPLAPEAVRPIIRDEVEQAIKALPAPQPGRDADNAAIAELVLAGVERLSKTLSAPAFDADAVRPQLAELVDAAIKALPAAQPGKDADNAAIAQLVMAGVEQLAKAIPAPKDGEPGASVTLEDVRPLIEREAERAAAALPRPEPGRSVPIEDVERMVETAVAKAVGALQIKNGEPGRDALDLRPIPAIDVEKSYPRETYALHAGGLWRSFEATEGMKGWEVAVNGLSGIDFEDDASGRPVAILTMTNGEERRKAIPAIVFRDVFREGTQYIKGDAATFGGSTWHCNEATTTKPEPGNKAWTLMTKRGRDGKDGDAPGAPPGESIVRLR